MRNFDHTNSYEEKCGRWDFQDAVSPPPPPHIQYFEIHVLIIITKFCNTQKQWVAAAYWTYSYFLLYISTSCQFQHVLNTAQLHTLQRKPIGATFFGNIFDCLTYVAAATYLSGGRHIFIWRPPHTSSSWIIWITMWRPPNNSFMWQPPDYMEATTYFIDKWHQWASVHCSIYHLN